MRRGAVIIIVGLLLIVITAVVYVAWTTGYFGGGGDAETTPAEPAEGGEVVEPAATLVPQTTKIVVALQDIPRGWELTEDVLALWDWPIDSVSPDAILGSDSEDYDANGIPDAIDMVVGKRMRTSTVRFEPILNTMVADNIDLVGTGGDGALAVPPGRVLIAYPLPAIEDDPTSAVAYAVRGGDRVDLMISLALVDLDEEFHTKLPNASQLLDFVATEGGEGEEQIQVIQIPYGRIEEGPLGLIFNVVAGEENQRPRQVTQLTVQNALVVRVGRYPTTEEEVRGIDPQAPPTPTPTPVPQEGEEGQAATPAPPPPPEPPDVIILAVTPQEALVIKFAREINAKIDFAIRGVDDQALFQTNPVTLQYLMETYNIAVPPKLQYGVEPPVLEIPTFIEEVQTQ